MTGTRFEWQQAFSDAEESLPLINKNIGEIAQAHNRLHYILMHMAEYGKNGTLGSQNILKVHQEKRTKFDDLVAEIRKQTIWPTETTILLENAETFKNNRNQIIHGLLMEWREIPSGRAYSTFAGGDDEDRLGFGKANIKTGELETVSLRGLDFWNLAEKTLETWKSLRLVKDGLQIADKQKVF